MNVANVSRKDAEGAAVAVPQVTSMEERREVLQKLWWKWKGILPKKHRSCTGLLPSNLSASSRRVWRSVNFSSA
jgi:hypothetical protein